MEIVTVTGVKVDFAKLRSSNDLLLKWGNRANVKKAKYVQWCIRLWQNPEAHKKTLPVNLRSAFAKDCKSMFYAAEVDGPLIQQYTNMIYHVMNKLGIPEEEREDLIHVAMSTIRYAVWQFRNHKIRCGFTTWCHNTLFLRLKKHHITMRLNAKRRKARFPLASQIGDTFSMDNYSYSDSKINIQNLTVEAGEVFTNMLTFANLSAEEKCMLECFMKRHDKVYMEDKTVWYSEYLDKFMHTSKTGRLTREAVRLRLIKLQKKLWFAWHRAKQEEAPKFVYQSTRLAI